jgi:predicted Holliday junction resolvase-like endonuclease
MSKGNPTQITVVEIKKGTSTTTKLQNQIRDLIKEGKVVWELIKLK